MTEGEKMVWAAAYATRYEAALTIHRGDNSAAAVDAIEGATYAVEMLREVRAQIESDYGGEHTVFLDEVLR